MEFIAFIICISTICLFIAIHFLGLTPTILHSRHHEPIFLNDLQTHDWILRDQDGYMSKLTNADLHARNASSVDNYKENSANSAINFYNHQIENITACTQAIDAMPGLVSLKNIQWIFCLTKNNIYENGLPHTRGSVICLTPTVIASSDLLTTLIHEKIHVYQRLYPDETSEWIAKRNYKKTRQLRTTYHPLIRSNPDLDDWMYITINTNITPIQEEYMASIYKSSTPNRITDTFELSEYEHPFEVMAYQIAKTQYM
jgi:hypothetical protein